MPKDTFTTCSGAAIAPARPLLTEVDVAPYRLEVLHELRAWHESQAADCYGGANDAHTASIAEIDRLMEVEKAKS